MHIKKLFKNVCYIVKSVLLLICLISLILSEQDINTSEANLRGKLGHRGRYYFSDIHKYEIH